MVPLPDAGAPKIIARITGERKAAMFRGMYHEKFGTRLTADIYSGIYRYLVSDYCVYSYSLRRHLLLVI